MRGDGPVTTYANRQQTGEAWLGEVPSHWAVLPNRAVFREIDQKDNGPEEMLSVTIGKGVIRQADFLDGSSKKDSSRTDRSNYKLVCPGDIAYNKMRAWQGALGVSQHRGIVSPAYIVQRLRSPEHLPRYYHYLMRTPKFAKEAERWSHGIVSDMWSLRPIHFKAIRTIVPPPEEQAAIVRYLDHATARLDQAVTAKRRVVALLEEQKQAVIHRAVIRGLDETAPMKDSGVPWLGKVPVGWEVLQLKRVLGVVPGYAFPSSEFKSATAQYRLLRGINVGVGSIRWDQTVGWDRTANDGLDRFILRSGDIVIGMDRPIIAGGVRVAIATKADTPSMVLQRVGLLRPRPEVLPEWAYRLLSGKSFLDYITPMFSGISVPHMSGDQIGAFAIPVPPVPEQRAVLDAVRVDVAHISSTIEKLEREIALLQEYRTALVAEVVTGQRDVRALAAALPPLTDEAPLADQVDDDALPDALLKEADAMAEAAA